MGWYLCYFLHRHLDFRREELQALADMADKPVRWIVDDAGKFTAREARRGRRYDAILLDPPKFGRGPAGERWQIDPQDYFKEALASLGQAQQDGLVNLHHHAITVTPIGRLLVRHLAMAFDAHLPLQAHKRYSKIV